MTRPLLEPRLNAREQLAAKQIDAIKSSALRIEPENGDPELVRPHPRRWHNTTTSEDQPPSTVTSDDGRSTLNELDFQIPSLVFDPAEIARPVQIAHVAWPVRRYDCVRGPEVAHPLLAELDGFIVRGSPWSWFRRLSHRSRVHPSSDTRSTLMCWSTQLGPVGGKS